MVHWLITKSGGVRASFKPIGYEIRTKMPSPVKAIIGAFIIVITLMIGVSVLDTMQSEAGGGGDEITRQAALLQDDGEYVTLNNGKGTGETVYKTTGYAVNLTGASDSYIESTADVDVATSDTWTISVWAYVDEGSGNDEMIAASVDGRAVISYNGTANQWEGWYYDDGSRNSYEVNITTSGNEVGNFTNVMLWHNNGNLAILRNNESSNLVSTSGGSTVSAPVTANNWNGRLEELRTFDDALNNSERNTIINTPVEQMPNSDPTARAMFDQPGRDTQLLLYTDADIETSNVTYSDGFAAQEMQGDGNLVGADYRWEELGPKVAPIEGEELSGAPVAYVSYDLSVRGADKVVSSWSNFTDIASLVPVILIGIVIIGLLSRLNG